MKKKQNKIDNRQDNGQMAVNDRIDKDVIAKLKLVGKQLKDTELQKQEEAREQERQRRKEKEKNKSFEELFEESSLDWKSFK